MIRIEKSILLGHTYEVEVDYMLRDKMYGVELSRLRLNLIGTEYFNAVIG